MKIVFTIFTTSHGKGGHFHSLKDTAEAIQKKEECLVLNIGLSRSSTLEESDLDVHNILITSRNILRTIGEIDGWIKQEDPSVIHCFCKTSYSLMRLTARKYRIPLILTKCGGPNPRKGFPFSETLILYSVENYNYFKSRKKYANSNLHLIPNRIVEPVSDVKAIKELRSRYPGKIVMLQIGRITAHYEASLIQSINLNKELNNQDFDVHLILLGVIQDQGTFDRIQEQADHNITILKEEEYTNRASRLIEMADIVIGTGRSLMEAASKSKIVLTPVQNSNLPELITRENFESFFSTNFSPRNRSSLDPENPIVNLKQILGNESRRKEAEQFSRDIFTDYFDVASTLDKYRSLYNNSKPGRRPKPVDYLVQLAITHRHVTQQIRKNART